MDFFICVNIEIIVFVPYRVKSYISYVNRMSLWQIDIVIIVSREVRLLSSQEQVRIFLIVFVIIFMVKGKM